jgi:hypothetical protein
MNFRSIVPGANLAEVKLLTSLVPDLDGHFKEPYTYAEVGADTVGPFSMWCLAEGTTKLLYSISDLNSMLATGLVMGEVSEDLQAVVDESIEELKPVVSKITFVLTIPFILRTRPSELALTLQDKNIRIPRVL